MVEHTPTAQAADAAKSLPSAITLLERAVGQREFVKNRGRVAQLTLTIGVPGSVPIYFHLEGAGADAVLALLPDLAEAAVTAAKAEVKALAAAIDTNTGNA